MIKSKIIFLTVVCSILISDIYGQSGKIKYDLFSSATKKAIEKSRVFPRRQIVTEETYKDGNPASTDTLIWEAVSIDKDKIVRIVKIGDNVTKLEEIRIDGDIYKRFDDGEWKKEEWYFRHGLSREITEILGCAEYSLRETTYDNQKARIFGQFSIGTNDAALTYEQEDFWIGGDGNLLKQETTYGLLNPRNVLWHKTIIYEYDANIKIEAPEIIEQ